MTYTHALNSINWEQYLGPKYYNPNEASLALHQLLNLNEEQDRSTIYNHVLSAIGNNHRGTYYPVIIDALDIIIGIAFNGKSEIARNCSLDMMIDLYCAFCPELGTYNNLSFEELETIVKSKVEATQEHLESIYLSPHESDRNRQLIKDLIEAIKEAANQ